MIGSEISVQIKSNIIKGLAYRKNKSLAYVLLPEDLRYIGDAAFSYCKSLHSITIPSSVLFIGVAAFCSSGLEEVTFLGTPGSIESSAFVGCKHLKRIIVPKGAKISFCKMLYVDESLIVEQSTEIKQIIESANKVKELDSKQKTLKKITFNYNYNLFEWRCGDEVFLDDLFSGPTTLMGNPSFQFRRKALFIFVQSNIANKLEQKEEYEIPANVSFFSRKYQEKYPAKTPRIFIFICNNGKVARVYDEVVYVRTNRNSITVKSLLRI
jgi:hypothetical protein